MSKTWKKDTDDLFDFDTTEVENKTTTLSKFEPNFFLVYIEEKLKIINSLSLLLDKFKEMQKKRKILENNNNIRYIENNTSNNSNEGINFINNNNIINNNNNLINNMNNNNNSGGDINSLNNVPSFLIVSEFNYIPPYTFKITCPMLSPHLRKNLKESYLCRSWRLCKKDEENLISIGDVIKLGRARLKIDTICIGEIFESCQINYINNYKKKKLSNFDKKHLEKILLNQKPNIDKIKEKDLIENSKVSKISEMREEGLTHNPNINELNNNSGFSSHNPQSSKTSKPTCRICFLSSSNENNPLISPCKCSGSMKYIHYICLKKCIETKIIKKTEQNFKSYSWKSFSCEICKAEYPKYIKIKESLFSLVDLEINYTSYVTCDYTLYDDLKKKTFRKGIIIFKINEEKDKDDIITVGRSQNNKIKLKDISVSRNHCNFIKKKNKLYIVDKGSKFGTLIYLNSPMIINPDKDEGTLISGKHLFSVNLIRKQNFLCKFIPICFCEYQQINPKTDIEVFKEKICDYEEDDDNKKIELELSNNNIMDELHQDYVLDLGNDIYIYSEIESEKFGDKIS